MAAPASNTTSIPLVCVTTVALLAALTLGSRYERHPEGVFDRTRDLLGVIVSEQVRRSRTVAGADFVFVGDSSCLLGIDFELLGRESETRVEGLCTFGFVGPRGQAAMLRPVLASGAPPRRVVLALHPLSLDRKPAWNEWESFVEQYQTVSTAFPTSRQVVSRWWRELDSPEGILRSLERVRARLFEPLVYTPLPGAYARYHGGERAFAAELREHRGGTIDPTTGLAEHIESAAPAATRLPTWTAMEPSPSFHDSLMAFRDLVGEYPAIRFSLIMTPIRESDHASTIQGRRRLVLREIADRLDARNLDLPETPAWMSDSLFATREHLNRQGRRRYTLELLEALQSRPP